MAFLFLAIIEDLPAALQIFHNVYVRKCYPELLILICQKIDELLKTGQHNMAIRVTGTPGMGKSFFLGYIWYHLLKVKCDVVAIVGQDVIRSRKGSEERGAYDVITMEDYKRLSMECGVIFLADPHRALVLPRTNGISIFFVSPAHEAPRDYPRTNLLNLFMPPWKEEELRCCIEEVYPQFKEHFDSLFTKWGGSIRCLTLPAGERSRNELLQGFLQDHCLKDVVNTVEGEYGILKGDVKIYQWLVHMIPIEGNDGSTNYEEIEHCFPTHYISSQVAQKIRGFKFDWKTLGQARMLGNAYESHILNTLFKVSESETSLPVKAKGVGNNKWVSVPAVKKHEIFSSKLVIDKHEKGTLYIPIEPNRPGIDLIMPPWVFQVTIQKTHTAKKLEKTLDQFPSVKKWELCFVLPSAIVDEFTTPRVSLYPSIKHTYKLKFDFDS